MEINLKEIFFPNYSNSLTINMDDISNYFNNIFNSPVFSDGGIPVTFLLYISLIAMIFVSSIIYSVFHNLSDELKKNKIHMIIILVLFLTHKTY